MPPGFQVFCLSDEPLAQSVEQQPFKLWVAGSIPARLTISLKESFKSMSPSSRGLGLRTFIPVTGVRIPLGTPRLSLFLVRYS